MTHKIKIGLEIHAQLNTKSKLFCYCATQPNEENREVDEPNTRTCPICLGMPGSKPLMNEKALRYAVRVAKTLNCSINEKTFFSRKTYFYPDLAKNFQITQFEVPIGEKGNIFGAEITRVHLEEDPASIIHPSGIEKSEYVLVDYNRSGIPLVEIVTEPCFYSPQSACEFLVKLTNLLKFIKVFDPKKSTIKADTNISIRETNFTRVEIKNMGSVQEMKSALDYEITRHIEVANSGRELKKETRSWDSENDKTISLRDKEDEDDYGYIYEPDLLLFNIKKIAESEEKNAVNPEDFAEDLVIKYKLPERDAKIITSNPEVAYLFSLCAENVSKDTALRWVVQELVNIANHEQKELPELELNEREFLVLLKLIDDKKISEKTGKDLLIKLVQEDYDISKYVNANDLLVIEDSSELDKYCAEVINENPKVVLDYKQGKEEALNFLLGQVMRKSKGKADARVVKERLEKLLALI